MAEPVDQQNEQPARQGRSWLQTIGQIILFQMIMRYFRPAQSAVKDPVTGVDIPPLQSMYSPDMRYDLHFFVSDKQEETWESLTSIGDGDDQAFVQRIWSLPDLSYTYDRWRPSDTANLTLNIPADILRDIYEPFEHAKEDEVISTEVQMRRLTAPKLYMHASILPHHMIQERDPKHPEMAVVTNVDHIHVATIPLIEVMAPFTQEELQSLLDDEPIEPTHHISKAPVPHFKAGVDARLAYETGAHPFNVLAQPPFANHVRLFPEESLFAPPLFLTDFWLLEREHVLLNSTALEQPLNFRISYNLIAKWSFVLQVQMADAWNPNTPKPAMMSFQSQSRKEVFMLKRILMDTNPFFLAFSGCFMLLHTVFSMLAFKNDVQFWNKRDSMEGLSAGTTLVALVCEVVIGLYLLDSEKASWLILFEIAMSIAISCWKVTKAIDVSLKRTFPFIKLGDKKNYSESSTKKYDNIAIRYMSVILVPCFIGYAVYSLKFNRHKSWYSYVVGTLAGGVYTFGFVMMTPQLYINYRLKSVDHLPWRALIYRALNTFVDDIAAFVIDMPMLHRLACFRDDIIFVIYLYQRWVYRSDKTRGDWAEVDAAGDAKKLEEEPTEPKIKISDVSEENGHSATTVRQRK